jgi:hypothetical protein
MLTVFAAFLEWFYRVGGCIADVHPSDFRSGYAVCQFCMKKAARLMRAAFDRSECVPIRRH